MTVYGCQKSDILQGEPKADMAKEDARLLKATFAGGCFWCSEADFEKLSGVAKVMSGYTGGETENPSYAQVSSGDTGHVEVVQVSYDPSKISYEELLDAFWRHIDPTDSIGQFVDRGLQYRSAIFYHDEEQKQLAENRKTRSTDPEGLRNLLLPKLSNLLNFMKQRITTKIIIKSIL